MMSVRFLSLVRLLVVVVPPVLLAGCATEPAGPRVADVRGGDGVRVSTRLTRQDQVSLADRVTDEMLSAEYLFGGEDVYAFSVGRVRQNTHDYSIRTSDMVKIVTGQLLNTGIVRVFDRDSRGWRYEVEATLNSVVQRNARGAEDVTYTLTYDLKSLTGETLGTWDASIRLVEGERPLL